MVVSAKYLKRYGYLHVDPSKVSGPRPDVSSALRDFQAFMGLPADGTYNDETMNVIYQPRCGVIDPVGSDQSFTLLGGRWNKTDLTYRIQGSVPGFRQRQIASVVQEAFDMFTPYVPMTFTPVSKRDPADIQIMFQSHEDDPDMDGRGKTVGWAYPPLADSRDTGKIYIDSEEDYTIEGPEGTPMLAVVAHEIGHVLGMGHTSNHASIMQPCVPAYSPNYQLTQCDIDALNHIMVSVGCNSGNVPEVETPAAERAFCQFETYDAVTVMDSYLYVFKGDKYWKLTTDGALLSSSEGALISDAWPEVVRDVDVVYKNSLGHVVITKGGKYYEYDVTEMLFPWAPSSIRDMNLPKSADAGYSIRGTGFFMRSGKLWSMDEVNRGVHPDSPQSLRRLWGYSPENVDSAFILNGTYLFKFNCQRSTVIRDFREGCVCVVESSRGGDVYDDFYIYIYLYFTVYAWRKQYIYS
ncbi:putative 72 kDa type IV collagenase [Apostichopus japonicus]|uniref:Putative 72 kDa type IV collagenase n=1 Tax=Stichopus japonicus TaxID=307972 RepID=A0A2G8KRJ8_STIJA|nr:putative 72 kDa type IV collagenase [Apostichopus japonicus]